MCSQHSDNESVLFPKKPNLDYFYRRNPIVSDEKHDAEQSSRPNPNEHLDQVTKPNPDDVTPPSTTMNLDVIPPNPDVTQKIGEDKKNKEEE